MEPTGLEPVAWPAHRFTSPRGRACEREHDRGLARRSASEIVHAALARPVWLKVCGKLPSCSPVSGFTSSASRPRSFTMPAARSNTRALDQPDRPAREMSPRGGRRGSHSSVTRTRCKTWRSVPMASFCPPPARITHNAAVEPAVHLLGDAGMQDRQPQSVHDGVERVASRGLTYERTCRDLPAGKGAPEDAPAAH